MADGTLKVGTITTSSGSGTITLGQSGETVTIPSGVTLTNNGTASGLGKVLQVLQTVKTDTFSTSSTSFTDITGLSVSITPSSTSNKILIMFDVVGATPNLAYVNLVRNSTTIGIGETSGSRISCTTGNFSAAGDNNRAFSFSSKYLDSPSTTSATTYKLQIRHESGGASIYINRTVNDNDGATGFRPISTITAMEIQG